MESENKIIFATYVAMQIASEKTDDEIRELVELLGQVCCSLNNLLSCRKNFK